MEFGLDNADLLQIKNAFSANPKVEKVIMFGSRAMGNYGPGSDIDLTILGDLTFSELLDINQNLDKIGLLYSFDLQLFNGIKDKDVLDHINRVGKVLYP